MPGDLRGNHDERDDEVGAAEIADEEAHASRGFVAFRDATSPQDAEDEEVSGRSDAEETRVDGDGQAVVVAESQIRRSKLQRVIIHQSCRFIL